MTTASPSSADVTVLRLSGGLRAPTAGALGHRIEERLCRGARHILLDLSGVSHLDAAGLGELARAYRLARAVGSTLRIVHASGPSRTLLDRAGLLAVLEAGREGLPDQSAAAAAATPAMPAGVARAPAGMAGVT